MSNLGFDTINPRASHPAILHLVSETFNNSRDVDKLGGKNGRGPFR